MPSALNSLLQQSTGMGGSSSLSSPGIVLGSVLETSPTSDCSLELGCLKEPTAHCCLKGPTEAHVPSRAGSFSSSSSSQEASGVQSPVPAQSPRWLCCLLCLCLSQLPALCLPQLCWENSQGPQERREIRQRQPVHRDNMHTYTQQFLQYETETSKVSKDFKKCLQVAWASRDWL